jgi:hypothetical protein
MIDGHKSGNKLNFINFSHQPNLDFVVVCVKDVPGWVWGLKGAISEVEFFFFIVVFHILFSH